MVGSGRFFGWGLVLVISACGSAGVSPKAFDTSAGDVVTEPVFDKEGHLAEPIVVSPEVVEGWDFLYRFITETEFVLCLEGSKQDGRIIVDGFRLARMEATSVNSVRYQPCDSPRYIGTAHNHPPVDGSAKSLCYQSEPDRRSFGMDSRAVVDIVLCGDAKFRYWLKDGRAVSKTVISSAR